MDDKTTRNKFPLLSHLDIPKPVLFRDPKQLYLKLEDNGWFDHITLHKADEMIRYWEIQKQFLQEAHMQRKAKINARKGTPRFAIPEVKGIFFTGSIITPKTDSMPIIYDDDDFPTEAPKLERHNAICYPEEESLEVPPAFSTTDIENLFDPVTPRPLRSPLTSPKHIALSLELREPNPLTCTETILDWEFLGGLAFPSPPPPPPVTPPYAEALGGKWEDVSSLSVVNEPPHKKYKP